MEESQWSGDGEQSAAMTGEHMQASHTDIGGSEDAQLIGADAPLLPPQPQATGGATSSAAPALAPLQPPRMPLGRAGPFADLTIQPPTPTLLPKQVILVKAGDSPTSHASERTRHAHTRKVTRDIAALDFLQNIPMRSELVHAGAERRSSMSSPRRMSDTGVSWDIGRQGANDGDGMDFDDGMDGGDLDDTEALLFNNDSLAGRRLPGFEAKIVEIPALFRYRFTTKYPAASAVVRRWEGSTAEDGLSEARMFFSRGCGYPLAVSTVVKYNGNETAIKRKRLLSVGVTEPMDYDWRGKSYYRLMHASWAPCDKDRDSQDDHPVVPPYIPNYLDDPEFRQGRHRHVVRGDKNIGPVVSSILLFVKPNDLKEELNKKFREKHTWLDGELSLSMIRNLKRETLEWCQRLDLEVASAALACVYFEKLVLGHYVNKANRKLYMSVCFLLAAKFSEPKASDEMKLIIEQILTEIDRVHSIPSREVLTTEFKVYAQLSFNLHVPLCEIHPHFTRLLKSVESNPRKYLDEDLFASYSTLIVDEQKAQSGAEAARSAGAETQDEGTDGEALLSDEETEERSDLAEALRLPWRNVSFSQWWRERTGSKPLDITSSSSTSRD